MAEDYNALLQKAMALGVKAPTAQQVALAKVQPTSGLGSVAQTNALLTQASQVTGIPATTFTEPPPEVIKLPEPPKDTTNYNAEVTYPVPTAPDTNFEDILKKYIDASGANTQKSAVDTFTGLESQLGIEGKEGEVLAKEQAQTAAKKELDLINAQLQGIQGTLQTDTLKLRGEGISAGAIGGRSINLEREAAIRAIPLQTQALIAQANLDSASGDVQSAQKKLEFAQGRVDTLFNVYSKDAEREWTQKQNLINAVYDFATKKEQAKLDDKRTRDEMAYNDRKSLIDYGRDLAAQAIEVGQAGLASQIMNLDPKSASYQSDLSGLAGQIKPKPVGRDGLTDYQTTQTFLNISNKYQADSIINQAVNGQTAVTIADQIIADPSSATAQLSSLYLFVKNLDPNSAVREGEIALANQAQSYLQRFATTITRINEGQVIAPDTALEFAKATKQLAQAWNQTAQRRQKQYQSQADTLGVGTQFGSYLGGYQSNFGNQPTVPDDNLSDDDAWNVYQDIQSNTSNQSSVNKPKVNPITGKPGLSSVLNK